VEHIIAYQQCTLQCFRHTVCSTICVDNWRIYILLCTYRIQRKSPQMLFNGSFYKGSIKLKRNAASCSTGQRSCSTNAPISYGRAAQSATSSRCLLWRVRKRPTAPHITARAPYRVCKLQAMIAQGIIKQDEHAGDEGVDERRPSDGPNPRPETAPGRVGWGPATSGT